MQQGAGLGTASLEGHHTAADAPGALDTCAWAAVGPGRRSAQLVPCFTQPAVPAAWEADRCTVLRAATRTGAASSDDTVVPRRAPVSMRLFARTGRVLLTSVGGPCCATTMLPQQVLPAGSSWSFCWERCTSPRARGIPPGASRSWLLRRRCRSRTIGAVPCCLGRLPWSNTSLGSSALPRRGGTRGVGRRTRA